MARPKGSKNKTRTVKVTVDYAAVVAEKAAEKEKPRRAAGTSALFAVFCSVFLLKSRLECT